MSFEVPLTSFTRIFDEVSVGEACDSGKSLGFDFQSREWEMFWFCIWLKFLIDIWHAEISDIC